MSTLIVFFATSLAWSVKAGCVGLVCCGGAVYLLERRFKAVFECLPGEVRTEEDLDMLQASFIDLVHRADLYASAKKDLLVAKFLLEFFGFSLDPLVLPSQVNQSAQAQY